MFTIAPLWQLTSPPFIINMELAAITRNNMPPRLFINQSEEGERGWEGEGGREGASAEFQLKNVFRVFWEKPSLCCWCVCHNFISWLETSVSTSVTPTSDFRGNAVQVSTTSLQCVPPAFLIYWHFTPFFYCAAENVPMHQVGDVTFVVAEALGPAVLVVLL